MRYILTLSCQDVRGIVAAVAGFITAQDGFIIESAQFGDPSTGKFFLRMDFQAGPATPAEQELLRRFDAEAARRFGMDWQIVNKARKPRLLILVSRHGHCLHDLLHRYHAGTLFAEIPAVISNHEDLRGIVEWHGIPYHYLPVSHANRSEQEGRILQTVQEERIDTVVLARYMQILSPNLCQYLKGRAINIHHSFLPSFKGARPYEQAYDKGVKLIGATAHYVTTDLDEGPIIEQEVARVDHSHRPEDLTGVGRDTECQVLARALRYHLERRVLLNGNKTVVFR